MVTTATSGTPRPATDAESTPGVRSRAALPRPTQTLAGALVFLFGASILVAAFDPDLTPGTQSLLFWCGLAVSLTAIFAVGLRPRARDWERLGALAGFGALLYLPYVLRSPDHTIFGEELYQGRSVRLLAETGHTPAQFPGLDFVAIWLHDTTGIELEALARIVPLTVHGTIPLLVFGIASAIGLSSRASFLAGLLYLANPAFFFLHSTFTPETLGILLFLALWAMVAACAREPRATVAYAPAIAACVAATVVTDHLSAFISVVGLIVLAMVTLAMRRRAADAVILAAAAIFLLNGWVLVHATKAGEYVSAVFTGRIDALVDSLRQQGEARGELFGTTQPLPLPERAASYVYPAAVLLLCLGGLFVLLRRQRARGPGPLFITLLILGPGLWTLTAPAVVGGASELAYRAWPFLFLGVALCAALGVRALYGLRTVPRGMRRVAVLGTVAVLLAGGIVVGDNIGGRFPRPAPRTAAGPESVTEAAIAAATWFSQTGGRDHRVVGDRGSELVFGTFGDQRPVSSGSALPFLAATPAQITRRLERLGTSYVVIDRRIALFPPRFGYYFGPEELAASNRSRYGQPFPLSQLSKFNSVKSLSLMYDNGSIAIYGPIAVATSSG